MQRTTADFLQQLVGIYFADAIKTAIKPLLKQSGAGHMSDMNSEPHEGLISIFEVPVTIATSESEVASIGARTTPGGPEEALILDIGSGTIDLVGGYNGITAAGAGELLSAAVAEVLNAPKGAA